MGLKVTDLKTVNSLFVRFPGLLHELGLSRRANEVLAVNLELWTLTRPPAPWWPPPSSGVS
ncbi:MAG: hypothetical protein V1806_09070 [Pseudomonadota bacterium]